MLAFRLARSGLAAREARTLPEAAACPASDFQRDAALLALAARAEGVTREGYDRAVDAGEVVVAHAVRGAIHAVAPDDHELYGRALLGADDAELGAQLGRQVQRLAGEHGFAFGDALDEVAEAVVAALAGDTALGKNDLHEALRQRVREDLMPWCRGCGSHHVAPMLWRYATVRAGVRLDAQRRYRRGGRGAAARPEEAVRRFLRFYGPATATVFAEWAGLSRGHAARLWSAVAGELAAVGAGRGRAWVLAEDVEALEDPPAATGVRLLPPGDPFLQKPNRALLAPDEALRKRLFRPVASPGAVLRDGRLEGLWRARAKGARLELEVERLGRLPRAALDEEAGRLAALRGAADLRVTIV